jgi:D-alanyl-D-alanine carboxypeptidase
MIRTHQIIALLIAPILLILPMDLQVSSGVNMLSFSADAHAAPEKSAKKSSKKSKAAKPAKKTRKKQARQVTRTTVPAKPADYAELVVDANTGTILFEKNAEQTRHPASLTKMMTLYLLFEALEKKEVSMSTLLPVSAKAAGQPPTNIFLDDGDQVPVRTAIEALIIRSANDVAMVVAEALGNSQDGFALMMNKKARELGMSRTRFYNPSGLPDDRQVTTAMDMAKLGIALRRDFPEHYHYFSQDDFSFNGRTYTTHNRLLGRYPGADGIKTGYIRASGFNLVTSVERGRTRLVGVVLGGRTGAARDQEMMDILDQTFMNLANKPQGRSIPVTPSAPKPKAVEPKTPETAPVEAPPAESAVESWGIQVGAYLDQTQAQTALNAAESLAKAPLADAVIEISTIDRAGQTYYRARLLNLSNADAREACNLLTRENRSCMMVRVGD